MEKTFLPILLNILYNKVEATHNLSGIIATSAKYTTKYGTSFKRPTRPKPYIPTITATMSDAERHKAKATDSVRKEDYQLYEVAEMGIMRSLTTNIDKTWYQELEKAETFCTEVTAFKLTEHVQKHSGGRHAIDAVDIISDMHQYFDEAAIIPIYISMMEATQKTILAPSSPSPTTCWSP